MSSTKVYSNSVTGYGGGVAMEEGTFACTASSSAYGIYKNTATSKGGAAYISSSTASHTFITSTGCYWGHSTSDNSPADIDGSSFSSPYSQSSANGSTFTCTSTTCN